MRGATHEAKRYIASLAEDGRYRLLVESVRDYAIYILDQSDVVTSWNREAMQFKGYEAQEIVGQHFPIFYDAPQIDESISAKPLCYCRDSADLVLGNEDSSPTVPCKPSRHPVASDSQSERYTA